MSNQWKEFQRRTARTLQGKVIVREHLGVTAADVTSPFFLVECKYDKRVFQPAFLIQAWRQLESYWLDHVHGTTDKTEIKLPLLFTQHSLQRSSTACWTLPEIFLFLEDTLSKTTLLKLLSVTYEDIPELSSNICCMPVKVFNNLEFIKRLNS